MTLPVPLLPPLLPRISSGVLAVAVGEARVDPTHANMHPGPAVAQQGTGAISKAAIGGVEEHWVDGNRAAAGRGVVADVRTDAIDHAGGLDDALLQRHQLRAPIGENS